MVLKCLCLAVNCVVLKEESRIINYHCLWEEEKCEYRLPSMYHIDYSHVLGQLISLKAAHLTLGIIDKIPYPKNTNTLVGLCCWHSGLGKYILSKVGWKIYDGAFFYQKCSFKEKKHLFGIYGLPQLFQWEKVQSESFQLSHSFWCFISFHFDSYIEIKYHI